MQPLGPLQLRMHLMCLRTSAELRWRQVACLSACLAKILRRADVGDVVFLSCLLREMSVHKETDKEIRVVREAWKTRLA